MSNTFEKAPDGPTTEAKKKNVPLSETDNGTVVSAGTVESSDRVTNILQDPDSERLIQALKGDREAKNGTKVEMIAVAPGDEEGFQEWMKKYTTIFTDPNDMEDEETIHETGKRVWQFCTSWKERCPLKTVRCFESRLASALPQ
jgi:hypothetical protein